MDNSSSKPDLKADQKMSHSTVMKLLQFFQFHGRSEQSEPRKFRSFIIRFSILVFLAFSWAQS